MSDWDTVTVLRKKPVAGASRSTSSVNQARRMGAEVETTKKYGAGTNRQGGTELNTARLDEETEELSHKKVSLSVGQAILRARNEKQLTQKDLAQKINEKPSVVADYEQARTLPNQTILAKMERVLGVKLRGSNIGDPLAPKAPKK